MKSQKITEVQWNLYPSSHMYCAHASIVHFVRFKVLTAASMMFRVVFWVILPCKIIVDRRFRGAYCLHHQGSSSLMLEAGRTSETSVDNHFTRQYNPEDSSEHFSSEFMKSSQRIDHDLLATFLNVNHKKEVICTYIQFSNVLVICVSVCFRYCNPNTKGNAR
jgi:hypothetical protein